MIYICEYTHSLQQDLLSRLAAELPLTIPEGWQTGRRWEKARQRILAWLLLAYGIEQEAVLKDSRGQNSTAEACTPRLKQLFEQLAVRRTADGKPYSAAVPEFAFNLSHCDMACACIIGTALQCEAHSEVKAFPSVGIDVERKFPYKENLNRSLCHEKERAVLQKLDLEEQQRQQQILWSLKESLVKLNGRGLGYGLREIDLSAYLPIENGEQRQQIQMKMRTLQSQSAEVSHTYTECIKETEYRLRIQAEEAYTLAACAELDFNFRHDESLMNIRKVTEEELAAWLQGDSLTIR